MGLRSASGRPASSRARAPRARSRSCWPRRSSRRRSRERAGARRRSRRRASPSPPRRRARAEAASRRTIAVLGGRPARAGPAPAHGPPPQTSTTRPPILRNSDFWTRAVGSRARVPCGSSPERFGRFSTGGGLVPTSAPPSVRSGPCPRTIADPRRGSPDGRQLAEGAGRASGPGRLRRYARAPIVRASTSAVVSDTWWSPNATCMSTRCAGSRQRPGGHVLGVAVGLAAVPQQLDRAEQQLAVDHPRVAG